MRKVLTRISALILACLLVVGPVGEAYAATGYSSAATLSIVGRGRAHGVGLDMSSVKNMALGGYSYSRILPYFYRGTRVLAKRLPSAVRVGVYRRRGAVAVTGGYGSGLFSVRTAAGRAILAGRRGQVVSVSYSSYSGLYSATLISGGRRIAIRRTRSVIRVVPLRGTILRVVNNRHHYRGVVELRWGRASRALWAVNIVSLEYYLRGLGEEPESWPFEGLKVLAIVSRGYAAYRHLNPKHTGDGFDICNTGDCQAYVGYDYERLAPRLSRAVALTRGRVVTYAGGLVITPYFSNSGGQTENIEYVWPGSTPRPWLRSVTTRWARPHPAYSWTIPMSFRTMTARLARSSATKLRGSLAGFRILRVGVSPRVRTMAILGSAGSRTVTGSTVQSVLGLQSTWFRFDMPPRLTSLAFSPTSFSPDGDGFADSTRLYFTLSESARVSYKVYNSAGSPVYWTYAANKSAGRTWIGWDGRKLGTGKLADGRYKLVLTASDARNNRNYASAYVTLSRALSFVSAQPATITPNGDGVDDTTTVSHTLARAATVNVHIDNSSGALVKTLLAGSQVAGAHQVEWDGKDAGGATVSAGTYRYSVSANDGTYSASRSGSIVVSAGGSGVVAGTESFGELSDETVRSLMDKLPGWLMPKGE